MLCGLVYNLRGLIVEYLRYDVSVSVSILQEQQLVFPSVTVCNMSPVKKSAMTSNNNNSNTSRRKRDVDNAVLSSNKRLRSFDNARSNRSVGSSNRSETTSENKGNKAVSSSKWIETDTKRYDNKTVIVPVDNQEKRTVDKNPVAKRRRKRSLDPCKPDWIQYGAKCYYVSPENFTGGLIESYKNCMAMGANLVSILNKGEQDFVASISIDLYGIEYWIGLLRFPETENNVTVVKMWWIDSSPVKYLNIDANETVDFTRYFYLDETGLWLTSYSNQSKSFICKMAANRTIQQSTTSSGNVVTTTTTPNWSTTIQSITTRTTGKLPQTTTSQPYTTSTKPPTTSTESPTTSTKSSTTSTKSHETLTESPTTSTKSPTTSTKSPTTSTKSPTTSTKSPTTSTKFPTTSMKSPTTSTKSPTTSTKSPTTSTESPTTSTKSPTTSTEFPTTSTRSPTTSTKSPSTSTVAQSSTKKITSTTLSSIRTPSTTVSPKTTSTMKATTTTLFDYVSTTKTTPTTTITKETTTPITTNVTPTTTTTKEPTSLTTTVTPTTTMTTETTTPASTKATPTSTSLVPKTYSTPLETTIPLEVTSTKATITPTRFETTTDITTDTANYTTTRVSTIHPDAPPIGCCCRCCSTGGQQIGYEQCVFCTDEQMDGASDCAVKKSSSFLATPLPLEEPNFEAARRLNGSRFPDRLAVTQTFQASQVLAETLASLPDEVKTAMGYSRDEFILDCRFDGQDCNEANDFTNIYNPIHGNCYVFNSGWFNSSNQYVATHSGRGHGLKLWLNIIQDEYTSESGDTAGAIVLIQSQSEMPFPEDEGILLSPGQLTSIAVTQKTTSRQPAPYSNCTTEIFNDTQRNVYAEKYPVEYTVTACQKTCYQRKMIEQCQCADPYVPTFEAALSANMPICSTTNITQGDCSYAVWQMFTSNSLNCPCPERCSDKQFSVISSLAAWPNNKQMATSLGKLAAKIGQSVDILDHKQVADNLLALEVYFETFQFEVLTESPSYPMISLFSDIGGVVGLWFGFAFMTFIEFLEYFVDLFILLTTRLFRNCGSSHQGSEQNNYCRH